MQVLQNHILAQTIVDDMHYLAREDEDAYRNNFLIHKEKIPPDMMEEV